MKLLKHKFLIPSFLGGFILLVPLSGFTQDTGWQLYQKGYWIKVAQGLGISYGGVMNKDIAAANPNSAVTMRSKKDGNGDSYLTVLKSTDKGNSWQTLYKDTNNWTSGYDVDHPAENVTGWVMRKGYDGNTPRPMLKYTTDGGQNIETLEHQVGGGIVKGDLGINVSMYNAKHWAFTTHDEFSLKDHTYLYITHDGGTTWEEKHFKVPKKKLGKYQVVMRSPKKVSLFPRPSGDAKTRISNDGGKTWQIHGKIPEDLNFGDGFEFPTANIGYAGGNKGENGNIRAVVYKTKDGGKTWNEVLEKQYPNLTYEMGALDVDCIGKNECITGGSTPNIIRTNDGGKTWLYDSVAFSEGLPGPDFLYTTQNKNQLALVLPHGSGEVFKFKVTDTTSSQTGKEKIKPHERNLSIYPNPSDGAFRISWQGQKPVKGALYNMQGQAVRSFQLAPQQEATYSLSGIQPGSYIFKVNGRDIAKKVVINQE